MKRKLFRGVGHWEGKGGTAAREEINRERGNKVGKGTNWLVRGKREGTGTRHGDR